MALIFWREGYNQISSALIATLLSSSYLRLYDIDTTKHAEILANSKRFENLACRTLQLCGDSDSMKATQNLMRKVEEFGSTTPIQISIAGNCMDFISHPVFQNLTVIIWFNKILPDTPSFHIGLVSLLFPFIAPWALKFRDKKPRLIVDEDEFEDLEEEDDQIYGNEFLQDIAQTNDMTFKLNKNSSLRGIY